MGKLPNIVRQCEQLFDHQPSILSDKEVAQNARKWPPNHQN